MTHLGNYQMSIMIDQMTCFIYQLIKIEYYESCQHSRFLLLKEGFTINNEAVTQINVVYDLKRISSALIQPGPDDHLITNFDYCCYFFAQTV